MSISRNASVLALAFALSGCALLGGGAKPPSALFTLTSTAPQVDTLSRSAAAGQAVTIDVPNIDKELRANRIAVSNGQVVQYVTGLTLADTPDKLFRELVSETVRRSTRRVVLDPSQTALDPGLVVTGKLQKFGYDAATGMAVVQYDAALSTQGGSHVEARRFTATAPADGTSATTGYALNEAANKVAMDVAGWIGG